MNTFNGWRQAGHAMRWARAAGARYSVHRYDDGRCMHTWEGSGIQIASVLVDPADHDVHVYAADSDYQLRLDTADTTRILDALVALGLIPKDHSGVFHQGRLAGQVDLARELVEARETCDIVEQAGRDAWQRVINR